MTPLWYEKFDYVLDPGCYPVGDRAMRTEAYYSPGICPEDWTTVQRRSRRGETTHNCCPSGFTIDTSLCRSTIRVTTTEAVLYYMGTRASSNPQKFTVTANDIVWASGIEIRFKDGDFGSSSRKSTRVETTTDETTAEETNAPTAAETGEEDTKGISEEEEIAGDGTPQNPQPQSSGSGGLSNGAKIGIGIGVPLAAIAIGALAFILWWRRRRGKAVPVDGSFQQQTAYPPGAPEVVMADAPGYDAHGNQYAPVPVTAYGDQAYKNPATDTLAPLGGYFKPQSDAGRRASELYAPGAHGGFAQQRPVSEVQGSSPNQSYTGTSPGLTPGGMSPPSGVAPSHSPQQPGANPVPGQQQAQLQAQQQQQQYMPYQPQRQVHEVDNNQVAMNSTAGPLPDHHELYPETVEDTRRH